MNQFNIFTNYSSKTLEETNEPRCNILAHNLTIQSSTLEQPTWWQPKFNPSVEQATYYKYDRNSGSTVK